MGVELKDIHELQVFKKLPLLETIFVSAKYAKKWIEAFERIELNTKIIVIEN